MNKNPLQVPVRKSKFSVNINSDSTILSGCQGVQEGYLPIVLFFNSERNLQVDRVKGVMEG